MSTIKVGILGLQGAYEMHHKTLNQINISTINVRYPEQLNQCDSLILPGGESTTMSKLIDRIDMREALESFEKPIFGTCAGAILLSTDCRDDRVKTLKKIPMTGLRNAYGRQVESFTDNITIPGHKTPFKAVFIRAPKMVLESGEIQVLATYKEEPVLLQYQNLIAASFHPELSNDPRIHQYFIQLIQK